MAHSSSVNCLKIGRKSSRVLVTGGEDYKVNLWAIGKPNAILVSSQFRSWFYFYHFLSALLYLMILILSNPIFYSEFVRTYKWD